MRAHHKIAAFIDQRPPMDAKHRRGHTGRAQSLRREQTDAERKLWRELRGRRLEGFKFKRQVAIGTYIADFMCFKCKLIVEVDGSQHLDQIEYDERRTRWLEAQGFRVARYWNIDVLLNTEGVVDHIWRMAQERQPNRNV